MRGWRFKVGSNARQWLEVCLFVCLFAWFFFFHLSTGRKRWENHGWFRDYKSKLFIPSCFSVFRGIVERHCG